MHIQPVIHPPHITYSTEHSIVNVTLQSHSTENDTIYIITIPSRDNESICTATTIHCDNEIINTVLLLLPGVMRSYCFMVIFL